MTLSRFHIAGMDCGAEEQLVRMRLQQIDEVEQVVVDLDLREVVVEHVGDVPMITAALGDLGLGARHLGDGVVGGQTKTPSDRGRERSALVFAFAVNACFFAAELTIGLFSSSMGLVADALDMGADAMVYALSLLAVGTSAIRKKRLARLSGQLQLVLAVVGLIEVGRRAVGAEDLPGAHSMIAMSLLALTGNAAVLLALQRVRSSDAHLQASWIFTANDIKVNLLVIGAALAVMLTNSAIPDLAAGALIFLIVAAGSRRILRLSR